MRSTVSQIIFNFLVDHIVTPDVSVQSGAIVPAVPAHVFADFVDSLQTVRFRAAQLQSISTSVELQLQQVKMLFSPTQAPLNGLRSFLRVPLSEPDAKLRAAIVESLFSPLSSRASLAEKCFFANCCTVRCRVSWSELCAGSAWRGAWHPRSVRPRVNHESAGTCQGVHLQAECQRLVYFGRPSESYHTDWTT